MAPRNGWIADFPVTPDIIADLDASIVTAADAGKLPMGKDDSRGALAVLNRDLGLNVTPAAGEAGQQPSVTNNYVENYYYNEGPPVVTYYPPPPDYYYLYAWDPFPFWCGGFFFPGFFVLIFRSRW